MSDISPSLTEISKKINIISNKDQHDRIQGLFDNLKRELEEINRTAPYPNQRIAANDALYRFINTTLRHCLLHANEQSGKTGTYHHLIDLMFEHKLIDNVYILCGSNELELLNQCYKDLEELHINHPYKDKIHIVFRQDFKKITMTPNRKLIIIDESHLVQGVNQTLNKFLARHKLSMAGTTPYMIQNNIYMVSVDATPYAEESAMAWNSSLPKFKIKLEDGEGYFGVKQYWNAGLIQPTFDLSKPTGKHNFISLLRKYQNKYIPVRITGRNKQKKWLLKWAEQENCDILHFTSNFDKAKTQVAVTKSEADEHYKNYKIKIPCLEVAPKNTTIVLIDGRLRCGKRVPKAHIGFVWEATKNGKTDIIRQSLLGRMCGYDVPLENKPLIFIPENILKKEKPNKVIIASDLERSIMAVSDIGPRLFNNSIPGTIKKKAILNGQELTPCVPIRFQLNPQQTQALNSSTDNEIKAYCLNKIADTIKRLIDSNQYLTDEQKEEIIDNINQTSTEETHLRHYKDSSNQNMYRRHVEAYLNNTSSREDISDYHNITFCVVHPGFVKPDSISKPTIPGEVYAIFYTHAKGYVSTIDKESKLAKINKGTHFTIQPTSELLECPAIAVYGFSPKILLNSDDLYRELDYFIECAKKNIGIFGKKFSGLHNGECITLPRNVYGQDLQHLKSVFNSLEIKHSITITYKAKKRRIPSEHSNDIELEFISWE